MQNPRRAIRRAQDKLNEARARFTSSARYRWVSALRVSLGCALMFFLAAHFVFANDQHSNPSSMSGYTRQLWQTQDGLPEGIVQAIAQTDDGYLWIGTSGGLVRFDGSRFTLFTHTNTPAFRADSVFCLARASNGTLWIGTEGGGLIRYRHGQFRLFSKLDGLTDDFVRTILVDHQGRIWVGTDHGLFRVRGDLVTAIHPPDAKDLGSIHALAEGSDGGIWVGGSKLFRLIDGRATEYPLAGAPGWLGIKSFLPLRDGSLLVGTISALMRLQIARGHGVWAKVDGVVGTVRTLHEMKDGSVWIGTIGHGLFVMRDNRFSHYAAPEVLPSNIVLGIYEDSYGDIWLGTQAGMLRLRKAEITTVEVPGMADSDFGSIYQDRHGTLWVASSRLHQIRAGKITEFHVPGTHDLKIRTVLEDSEGAYWFGTEGQGIYRMRGTRVSHFTSQSGGLANDFVRGFLQSRDRSVWIATDGGISHWVNGKWQSFDQQNGLAYGSGRALLEDAKGDLWIGTDGGLSHRHLDKFVNDEITRALATKKVWSLHQDVEGGLWFGTRGDGLYRWWLGRMSHFTISDGLASDSVYSVVEDTSGQVWLSSPNAVTMVARKEIDQAAEDPSFHPHFRLYGASEGLQITQMFGGIQPAGILASDGKIWFASAAGPVRIHPGNRNISRNMPRVVLDDLDIDGSSVTTANGADLGTGGSRIEFHFHAIQLTAHNRIRFRYRLDGFDKTWNSTLQGSASYTNLPPGRYTFRVDAFDANTPDDLTEASIAVTRRPHFYRTWWFALFCLMLSVGVIWGIQWRRTRSLKEKFAAVMKERSRVAGEIHDTIIQGCASVSGLLEAHRILTDQGIAQGDQLLNTASLQIRSTIDEARQAIWGLRTGDIAEVNIAEELRVIAAQLNAEFQLPILCKIKGRGKPVQRTVAHEIMMVTREGLYNAARHGRPKSVELLVQFDPSLLRIIIYDDGKGFDVNHPGVSKDQHFGLEVMRERIQRIGGEFGIETAEGQGTRLTISLKNTSLYASRAQL
ncbi:MAG TPA: two-component regulator propeller domain-containing protein [Alloacidobacterium sp.]|nr:two-component regulator propeller domain-containing protein [Alloacidobacterium sp.]